jgi:hypothetical protein
MFNFQGMFGKAGMVVEFIMTNGLLRMLRGAWVSILGRRDQDR